MVKINTDHY